MTTYNSSKNETVVMLVTDIVYTQLMFLGKGRGGGGGRREAGGRRREGGGGRREMASAPPIAWYKPFCHCKRVLCNMYTSL